MDKSRNKPPRRPGFKNREEAQRALAKLLKEDPGLTILNRNDSNENGPYTIPGQSSPIDPTIPTDTYRQSPYVLEGTKTPSDGVGSIGKDGLINTPSSKEVLDMFKERGVPFVTRDSGTGKVSYSTASKPIPPNRKNIKVVGTPGSSASSAPPAAPNPDLNTNIVNLTPQLARSFLVEDRWIPICNKIKGYREELDEIVEQLKKDKKRCTGCALNPYRAKLIPNLLEDFKDKEAISDLEIEAIKKELGVEYIQVGMDSNNKPHVR